jgi:glycosyltransferase involved in cell wall biosynthesis
MGVNLVSTTVRTDDPTVNSVAERRLNTLQIGMRWFGSGSGGLDRVFYDLANALPDHGIGVRGLVVQPADVAVETSGRIMAFARDGASLPSRLLGARRAIGYFVKHGNLDLVAAHFALYVSAALDRICDVPLVAHFHGPWAMESDAEGQGRLSVIVKKAIETRVYRRADRFIVLSEAFADVLSRRYGIKPQDIRIVPGSVDLDRFDVPLTRNEARMALGWPTDRPIMLSIRRLAARMGLDRLIAAMLVLVRAQPDVLLCIAGQGPLASALRQQIADCGLQNHVHLLGFLSEEALPLAYRAADINVVPTAALEGFGLTAAEALAAGTPSMVTPVGGLPEVVAELSPSLVFSSSDTADLAAGLVAALSGDIKLPGAALCRSYAEARFGTSLAAARTAAVYRELVR